MSELNKEQALELLQPNGLLSQALPGFEPRLVQQQMMGNIIDAYNRSLITLVEAGTGTGKSIAYLIPALLWAAQNKERTVISTNTIALQEQLIHKDIPILLKALKLDIKAVLIKGMSNYLCLRKFEDLRHELRFLSDEDSKEFEKIDAWKESTPDGSRSNLPFVPSSESWERVCAESDTCSFRKCSYYERCHFFRARKQANDAQILVANHHMLFADLANRAEDDNYQNPSILPPYTRIVLDEAHNIEDIATEYFASKVSHLGLLKTLSRLAAEKQGKLQILKEKIQEHYKKKRIPNASIQTRLEIDLPGEKNDILDQLAITFQSFQEFFNELTRSLKKDGEAFGENKLRVLQSHRNHPTWNQQVIHHTGRLVDILNRFVVALSSLERDIIALRDDRLDEATKNIRFEINALAIRLANASSILTKFVSKTPTESLVSWIETQTMRSMVNVHLVNAQLDISQILADYLFKKFSTIILCSATLTTNRQFTFMRQRLGLDAKFSQQNKVCEYMYESPFDFKKQALFAIPSDVLHPSDPDFIQSAAEQIWKIIQASRGNAFVLFTSYSMLKTCFYILSPRLIENKYVALKQGDENRQALLNRFRTTNRSVLFGTDSFWEGVDVAGDALRCVIIAKLPFKVPSEPIIQARTEAISAKGGDPFMDYSLPNAIVKFKQGFGRLIRNKKDRGCVICLDSRILSKGYGKQFLNSLPPCEQIFTDSASLQEKMSEFYRKTHYLVVS